MKQLSINNVKLANPLFLAPMVDVTDLAYRLVCRKSGAAMAYTEMLNISAILHTNKKTQSLMQTNSQDKPSGIQITGRSAEEFKQIIPYIKHFDIIDVNAGCPSSRITGNESGCYLLKNPKKLGEFIKILKDADLTVTAKIRLGWNKNNVIRISKEIEKAGADAITVHARLATQTASTPADWKQFSQIKKRIGIPVIGNGDINSGGKAEEILEICDGAMIGHTAIGHPLIFDEILHYLKTGKEVEFSFNKNWKLFQEYLDNCEKYDLVDMGRIKYIGSHFIRNIDGGAQMRNKLMKLKSFNEIKKFGKELSNTNQN